MRIKTLLLTAAAAAMLSSTAALADRDRDRDGRPDHSWAERHDRDGYKDRGRVRDRDRDGRPDNSWRERHDGDGYRDGGRNDWRGRQAWHWRDDRGGWRSDRDRYWRHGYRGYRSGDIYYRNLRAHGYNRWVGAPYWYQGRYVIRSYDRGGRVVFVEMNPYTGGFIGLVRF